MISFFLLMPWAIKKSYNELLQKEKEENYSVPIATPTTNEENDNIDKPKNSFESKERNDVNN